MHVQSAELLLLFFYLILYSKFLNTIFASNFSKIIFVAVEVAVKDNCIKEQVLFELIIELKLCFFSSMQQQQQLQLLRDFDEFQKVY